MNLVEFRTPSALLYALWFISSVAFGKGQEVGWKRDLSTFWSTSCMPALCQVLAVRQHRKCSLVLSSVLDCGRCIFFFFLIIP